MVELILPKQSLLLKVMLEYIKRVISDYEASRANGFSFIEICFWWSFQCFPILVVLEALVAIIILIYITR